MEELYDRKKSYSFPHYTYLDISQLCLVSALLPALVLVSALALALVSVLAPQSSLAAHHLLRIGRAFQFSMIRRENYEHENVFSHLPAVGDFIYGQ